jgi:hypothetical protein
MSLGIKGESQSITAAVHRGITAGAAVLVAGWRTASRRQFIAASLQVQQCWSIPA